MTENVAQAGDAMAAAFVAGYADARDDALRNALDEIEELRRDGQAEIDTRDAIIADWQLRHASIGHELFFCQALAVIGWVLAITLLVTRET